MSKKSSSNKPSKAGQATRTAANKVKHKKEMTEAFVKAHGSEAGMPDWDAKPDFTPHKQRVAISMMKEGKVSKTKK